MEDLEHYAKLLDIKQFRAVFMRDSCPDQPHKIESGTLILISSVTAHTGLIIYRKIGIKIYVDWMNMLTLTGQESRHTPAYMHYRLGERIW